MIWNHNIQHHRMIVNSVPDVVGIDGDPASVEQARQLDPGDTISYRTADFFAPDWPPASFDLVTSIAALHHMDAAAGLRRMRALLRPGGVLVVVGLAASELVDLRYSITWHAPDQNRP